MEGRINYLVFGGLVLIAVVAVFGYQWVKQRRTASQVRARSQNPAESFEEELGLWLSEHLSARWLIESAYTAATTTMRIEAIDFYNELAVRWNDEMGWAERKLIPTHTPNDQPRRFDRLAS